MRPLHLLPPTTMPALTKDYCCVLVLFLVLLPPSSGVGLTRTTATTTTSSFFAGISSTSSGMDNLLFHQQQLPSCDAMAKSMQVLEDFHSQDAVLSYSTESVKDSLRMILQFVAHTCATTTTSTNHVQQQAHDDVNDDGSGAAVTQPKVKQQHDTTSVSVHHANYVINNDENSGPTPSPSNTFPESMMIDIVEESDQHGEGIYPAKRRARREEMPAGSATCTISIDGVRCQGATRPTQLTLRAITRNTTLIINSLASASASQLKSSAEVVGALIVEFATSQDAPSLLIPTELWTELDWRNVIELTISGQNGQLVFNDDHTFQLVQRLRLNFDNLQLTNNSLRPLAGNLLDLEISNANSLTSLPPALFHSLSKLLQLELGDLRSLTTLQPQAFKDLRALTTLDIHNTAISSLPPNLFQHLTSLQVLKFNQNKLKELPNGLFARLSSLFHLDLSQNQLTSIGPSNIPSNSPLLSTLRLHSNQLASLPPKIFSTFASLTELDVSSNLLTSIDPNIFPPNSQITTLDLNGNMLTSLPSNLLQPLPLLNELRLFDNSLKLIPPSIFASTPNLQKLYLHSNELRLDNETSFMLWSSISTLTVLEIGGNQHLRLNADHFSFKLTLEALQANDMELFIPPTNHTPISGANMSAFPSLTKLGLDGTPMSIDNGKELVFFFATLRNLTHFAVGYEGFFDLSLNVPFANEFLCTSNFLSTETVTFLKVTHSAARRLTICPETVRRVDFLDLSDNPILEVVEVNEVGIARVTDSRSLKQMTANSIDRLDISGTSVPFTTNFCNTLGTELLYIRNMRHPSFHQPSLQMEQLLRNCIEKVNVLDISNTIAFRDPAFMTRVLSQPIRLADCDENRDQCRPRFTRDFIPGQLTVPSLIAGGHHYECSLDIHVQEFEAGVGPQFSFECECINEFRTRNGQCVNQNLSREQVAGVASGIALFFSVGIIVYVVWQYRRRIRTRQRQYEESDLEKNLLLEYQAQDLEVLKQAWEIDVGELRKIRKLDEGAFGEVWTCEWGTITVAVKYLKYTSKELGSMAQDYINDFKREADFLQRTRNPHVVRFFGTGTDQWGSPFIVLEYISLGSLRHLLDKGLANVVREYHHNELRSRHASTTSFAIENATMTSSAVDDDAFQHDSVDVTTFESQQDVDDLGAVLVDIIKTPRQLRHKLMRDVALGMDFLHKHGILHRDLKAGNVLVSKRLQAKLTDFGSISRHLRGVHDELKESKLQGALAKLSYSKSICMKSLSATSEDAVGTPLYMAPEVLMSGTSARRHSEKTDVFSYGVLLWEVATEQRPDLVEQEDPEYCGPLLFQLHKLLSQGRRLRFPDALQSDPATCVDEWYKTLYNECVSFQADERPSFQDVLVHDGWGQL